MMELIDFISLLVSIAIFGIAGTVFVFGIVLGLVSLIAYACRQHEMNPDV